MKLDFTFYNPTKIYFGKTAMDNLEPELKGYGKNILLIYGKAAIKKIGLYDTVITALKTTGKTIVELEGIKSNPTYSQMMDGARLVREHHIDLILAVGGGSVVDCAKAISVSAYCDGDPWQKYWVDFKAVDNKIIPVASILTMAGTASEMNAGSVITHEEQMIKGGRVFGAEVNPKFSILNPEYTYSVPKIQMVSGVYDVMSHLCEQYFSGDDDNTTDYLIEAVLKSLINSTRQALINPTDYEARSNIMWCATLGLNKITGLSKTQDWEVHNIEHQVGAYTDCPHGVGLAVVSIPYYKHIYKNGLQKFVRFAKNVWNINPDGMTDDQIALAGIDAMTDFIKEMGIPTGLRELGATEEMLEKIADSTTPGGCYKYVDNAEILEILRECYE
ncbi:MAG: iron-containing alcohol dehydrogenase [Clostridia bacterium]|nr:iron-containing alcohol dehydrogenase [Clostridia bacterium]